MRPTDLFCGFYPAKARFFTNKLYKDCEVWDEKNSVKFCLALAFLKFYLYF